MISILIPLYNGVEFIDESVSSVLNQTFNEWELLIGVNGHAANSEVFQIAKRYENEKIKVLDLFYLKPGKASALNEMLTVCKYDYVALLDVDDIWNEKKLEVQIPYLGTYDVVGTKCVYFGDINNVIPLIPAGDVSFADFKIRNPIINSSAVIRKRLCQWDNGINGVEDYDMWLRLRYVEKAKFFNCEHVAVKHRIHTTSAFNGKGNDRAGSVVEDLLQRYL